MDEQDTYWRGVLRKIRDEVNGQMRQSVILDLIEDHMPEDFSMWLAPGQTFKEFIQQQADKD